jgi:hypothetical protein
MTYKYNLIISIVNYNGGEYISQCLDLLLKACSKSPKKILIVCIDNNSFDSSKEIINKYSDIEKLYLHQNIGFASAHNQIFRNYDAEYFLLLNPDTLLEDEYNLDKMLKYMDNHPEIAMATCSILDENYRIIPSVAHQPTLINGCIEQFKFKPGFRYSRATQIIARKLSKIFPIILNNYNPSYSNLKKPLNVKFIYGTYLLLRKSALDKIGYFDENFFLFWEEIDLCIRARELKFSIGFNPLTFIIHKYQKSQMSVPELSYYWRVASYFWIFKKYHPFKLVVWSIGTGLFQFFLLIIKLVQVKRIWLKIHFYLFQLSISFGKNYSMLMEKIKILYSDY